MSTIIAMISENTEEHGYSVQRLYHALTEDISQQSLAQVAVWTIGEFGDLLISGPVEIEGGTLDVSTCVCWEELPNRVNLPGDVFANRLLVHPACTCTYWTF